MPTVRRPGPAILIHVGQLFLRRHAGSFSRIETDRNHVELFAGIEWKNPQAAKQAVQDECAQHRAVVIIERQDDRLLAEIIG